MYARPTNKQIKLALRAHMPNLDWTFTRVPPGESKGSFRSFKARREGIEYSVNVLSWWAEGAEQIPEYSFFIDGEHVISLKHVDHLHWAARCAVAIRKLAQQAADRASKLEDALERRRRMETRND